MTEGSLHNKIYLTPQVRIVAVTGDDNFLSSSGFSNDIGSPSFEDEDW